MKRIKLERHICGRQEHTRQPRHSWRFSDGQISAERAPQHQYENNGDEPKLFEVQLVGKLLTGEEIRSKIHSLTILPSPTSVLSPQIPPPQAIIGFDSDAKIEVSPKKIRFLDESSDNFSITIRPAPPKDWFQRFWWILIPAIFLLFIFGKSAWKFLKFRNWKKTTSQTPPQTSSH